MEDFEILSAILLGCGPLDRYKMYDAIKFKPHHDNKPIY